MKIEKSRISSTQLFFSVVCFIRSSSLLSSVFVSISNQDSWLIVILGMLICLPVLWIFISLMKAFPKMNLIEINDAVFGRIAGKAVSALYVVFFFTLSSLNLRDLGSFVNQTIMFETPMPIIVILFIAICAWAVHYGLEVVTRYSIVFVIISTVILVVTILATLNLFSFENFLPMFNQPIMSYVHSTHIVSTIPFGELVVFLMIAPNVDIEPKKIKWYFGGGFMLGCALILLVIIRDIGVLGNTMKYFALPSFETIRLVTIFEVLSHMEILYAILLITLMFFKISFLFYISMLALAHLFNLESYRILILPCAALIAVYSLFLFESSLQHFAVARESLTFLWTIFEMLLPLITLILAYIRKAPQKIRKKEKEAAKA